MPDPDDEDPCPDCGVIGEDGILRIGPSPWPEDDPDPVAHLL